MILSKSRISSLQTNEGMSSTLKYECSRYCYMFGAPNVFLLFSHVRRPADECEKFASFDDLHSCKKLFWKSAPLRLIEKAISYHNIYCWQYIKSFFSIHFDFCLFWTAGCRPTNVRKKNGRFFLVRVKCAPRERDVECSVSHFLTYWVHTLPLCYISSQDWWNLYF